MKKTVIVMPVANEEGTMEAILAEIMGLSYENLFVYPVIDSYSKDRTEEIIDLAASKYDNRIKKIFYKESQGVVSCYLEGFRQALNDGAERVIEMDGGGSHLPSEIPLFIDKLDAGYDCVWGSRFVQGGDISNHPLYRRFLSAGGTVLANLVLGTKLKDMTSGFEAFQSDVLKHMNLKSFLSRGHMYQTEMRYYCRKYKTIEVPIHYIGSDSGLGMQSVKEALSILFKLKSHENAVMAIKNRKAQ